MRTDADVQVADLRVADGITLGRDEIADVLLEALIEAQRQRGVADPLTSWFDAASAAELLLTHIANTCQVEASYADCA